MDAIPASMMLDSPPAYNDINNPENVVPIEEGLVADKQAASGLT